MPVKNDGRHGRSQESISQEVVVVNPMNNPISTTIKTTAKTMSVKVAPNHSHRQINMKRHAGRAATSRTTPLGPASSVATKPMRFNVERAHSGLSRSFE